MLIRSEDEQGVGGCGRGGGVVRVWCAPKRGSARARVVVRDIEHDGNDDNSQFDRELNELELNELDDLLLGRRRGLGSERRLDDWNDLERW